VSKDSRSGLRHFSLKVCEKVQEKNQTTYAEVADELVAEISAQNRITNPDAVPAPVRRASPSQRLPRGLLPLPPSRVAATRLLTNGRCYSRLRRTTRKTSGGACTTR
jgi:hypothetical protein